MVAASGGNLQRTLLLLAVLSAPQSRIHGTSCLKATCCSTSTRTSRCGAHQCRRPRHSAQAVEEPIACLLLERVAVSNIEDVFDGKFYFRLGVWHAHCGQ